MRADTNPIQYIVLCLLKKTLRLCLFSLRRLEVVLSALARLARQFEQ